jgi:hypothetical protein
MDPAPDPALGLLIPVDPEAQQGIRVKVLRAAAPQAPKVAPRPVRAAVLLLVKVALLLEGANPLPQLKRRHLALLSSWFLPGCTQAQLEAKRIWPLPGGSGLFLTLSKPDVVVGNVEVPKLFLRLLNGLRHVLRFDNQGFDPWFRWLGLGFGLGFGAAQSQFDDVSHVCFDSPPHVGIGATGWLCVPGHLARRRGKVPIRNSAYLVP